MKFRYKSLMLFAVSMSVLMFYGCTKLTEDHNAVTDDSLKKTLAEVISSDAELSTFSKYLVQTGYDKVISSSKNYTVFAPFNSALATLDAAVINDPVRLKKFVGNHIAIQLYSTRNITSLTRILMLNGKYNNMQSSKIEDANITVADKYATNGILQVIDKMLPALDNSWEFLSNNAAAPAKQKTFMLSLFRNVFDTSNAVIIGVNPTTGDPIYQAGTDSIYTNLFWNKVYDLRDEKKQYTLFMLEDAAWDAEVVKYTPYFVTNTPDSNTLVTSWNVLKDFAIDTVYNPSSIPDTIVSKFGTKLPVNRSAIVKTIKTSNGIIYILNKADVQPASKFKPYLIQAETYTATRVNRRGNTYFRDRFNPVTGLDFTDLLVYNHGVASFWVRYEITETPSIKYKAYWVAVNDFLRNTATPPAVPAPFTFAQKLGIGSETSATFGYTTVNESNYSEVYIGEFTMSKYTPLYNIYLVSANSTTAAANPLFCDYIKLVPSL